MSVPHATPLSRSRSSTSRYDNSFLCPAPIYDGACDAFVSRQMPTTSPVTCDKVLYCFSVHIIVLCFHIIVLMESVVTVLGISLGGRQAVVFANLYGAVISKETVPCSGCIL